MDSASTTGRASRNHRQVQSKVVNSHLCGLNDQESTRSAPSVTQRSSGHTAAEPAMAASTWHHTSDAAQTSAISGTGSNAIDDVVPAVAQQKNGTNPDARSVAMASASASGRIENAASVGTKRTWSSASPATRAPFTTDEWACSDV